MENSTQEDIFNITLSNGGAATIKRIVDSTKIVFLLGCITGAFSLLRTYQDYRSLSPEDKEDSFFHLYMILFSITMVIANVIWIYQVYVYRNFTRICNESIDHSDSESFNRSFAYLQRSNVISIVGLFISVFLDILSLVMT